MKPELAYLEIEISEACNLNCRSCAYFSNLVTEKLFYDLDAYEKDLSRLKQLFLTIRKIRLMGGEPLLNKQIEKYAEIARKVFPDCDLRIVTNGLLIPGLSPETLQTLKRLDCKFDISNYPPTRKKYDEISSVLNEYGVKFDLGLPIDFFYKNILQNPSENPDRAFKNCIFTHCHVLTHGRIYPCSFAYGIKRFNRKYNTDYSENDYTDIYDDISGYEIIEKYNKPHEFCKYCGKGLIPIKWKGGAVQQEVKEEDWLIKNTVLNTVVAPMAHAAIKPFAVRLRSYIQDRVNRF